MMNNQTDDVLLNILQLFRHWTLDLFFLKKIEIMGFIFHATIIARCFSFQQYHESYPAQGKGLYLLLSSRYVIVQILV